MGVATLVFSAIAAVGGVLAVVVASGPFLRLVEARHRRLDAVTEDYRELFGRLYRWVMEDLDEGGHVRPENAKAFTEIAGNEMYIHCGDEAEAWRSFRQVHEI